MRFTIGKKIAIAFGIVFVLNVMAALFSYAKLNELAKNQRGMNEISVPALDAAMRQRAGFYRADSATRGFVLTMGSDPSRAQQFSDELESAWRDIDASQAKLQELSTTYVKRENRERIATLGQSLPPYHELQRAVLRAASANKTAEAHDILLNQAASAGDKVIQMDREIDDAVHKAVVVRVQTMDQMREATVLMLVLSTLFSIVIGASFAFVISRRIVASVTAVAYRAKAIAGGDLTPSLLTVISEDEVGELANAVNQMQSNLTEIMRSIESDASNLASASQQLSSSATQLAQGSQTQTDQTQQVATAIHEMAATVQEISNNSMQAASNAVQTADTARKGGKVVDDVLSTMRAIASSVGSTANKIEALGKSSDQIGSIIAVIDDIADQTNLLALNAAIEAARAGEQGRGFAVVADEVRKLAERTTKATKEIAQMITNVQSETTTAVTEMKLGTKQVNVGVETTKQAGDSLKEIISAAEHVGDMINQIATAATEQASATDQIKASVESIASISKEASSGAHESAHACHELSSLVMNLRQMVSRFRLPQSPAGLATQSQRFIELGREEPLLNHGTRPVM